MHAPLRLVEESTQVPPSPRVLMVFPRFNPNSFWSFKEACELMGARCPAPPLGLITLAALLPKEWDLKLVNCNAEELTDADIAWADLVMTGGMQPQQVNTLSVMARAQAMGKPVCVGGPDPTSNPEVYAEADFRVLGEAEGIIHTFVEAWNAGERRGRFDAEKFKADVTKSPIPRYDLIDFKHYLYIGVQFSRGCPFTCEFCDIIELYGRVPRTKTTPQILSELDRLLELGYRGHVDFVDDNLIGNKKAIKLFLPELKAWQERNGYPFKFSTEASLNLSDDGDLLRMMREANFFAVFVGIESPDEATLAATQKKQNTRRSISESVERIYRAGMFVTAGFIVGFDTEKDSISKAMADCIAATNIPVAMVGLLHALPNTQLMRRLTKEGRLFEGFNITPPEVGDQCTGGLNFTTLRPRRDVLVDYRDVLQKVYDPPVFFERARALGRILDRPHFGTKPNWRRVARDLRMLASVCWRMTVMRPALARHFWSVFVEIARCNPRALEYVIYNMVIYLHLHPFSHHVIRELDQRIADVDSGRWVDPPTLPTGVAKPAPKKAAALSAVA